jgi:hypothetical protein
MDAIDAIKPYGGGNDETSTHTGLRDRALLGILA